MEAESSPPSPSGPPLTLTDLNADALGHCASFLSLQDVSNLAMSCKPLRRVAYSDAIWHRFFTERWPSLCISSGAEGAREKYLGRHIAVNQLKFSDPVEVVRSQYSIPFSHMLLKKNEAFLAQGSVVTKVRLESFRTETGCLEETLTGHNARITCMRLLPISDTTLFRATQNGENVLVTSSSDRTIRIWWKGRSHRCFKGHHSPVLTLADRLLGNDGTKVLASGGEDCTVRLWSVSGKHHPLLMTLHGHEKPVSLLSAAWHKPSLLVSMSTDSRVRVWDTAALSSSSSSSCVGMFGVPGAPVGLRCHESLCYIAAGLSVNAIDIRTMRKVATVAKHPPKIYSFEMLPSKWLICTGGEDKALLWDIRKNQAMPQPIAELEHAGRVTMLHMDPYKVVTGGPFSHYANVWDSCTGSLMNQLDCRVGELESVGGLSTMAVDGCRIISNVCTNELGFAYFRDYSLSSHPVSLSEYNYGSKFWEPQQPSDDESDR